MNLAFHYHVPCKQGLDGRIFTYGFFGLFVDSIADQSDTLFLLCYTPLHFEEADMTYQVRAKNISFIDLGLHNSVPNRLMRTLKTARIINKILCQSDIMLLRAPTPAILMLPFISPISKIRIYLVGSYIEGLDGLTFNPIKNFLIKVLGHSVEFLQRYYIKNRPFLSNSQLLLNDYTKISSKGILIKSTTLSEDDFFERSFKTENNKPVRILFTGRLDESKGIYEILQACELLSAKQIPLEFHFAGLILKRKENLPDNILQKTESGLMKGKVIYHGLKAVGKDLNDLYRMCDIYVLASRAEGFPKVIWEAMANSLPVIATKVGSIPYFLENEKDALLIDSLDSELIAAAILKLIKTPELANTLMRNGFLLAKDNTLKGQAKRLFETFSHF